jgi:Fe-S cluster assembly scaffold protein SufB
MNNLEENLLKKVNDSPMTGAVNIRKNGKMWQRKNSKYVTISDRKDGGGIEIRVKDNSPLALVDIPVLITESGLKDIVRNDFYIGKNSKVLIYAGCGINNCRGKETLHSGWHYFYIGENSSVKYVEKHYGEGEGRGKRVINPVTKVFLKKGAKMEIETAQIEGIDDTKRITKAILRERSNLIVKEKIMTSNSQKATTEFRVSLEGRESSCRVTSRAVATEESEQKFISNIVGNEKCFAHIACDSIIKDKGKVAAIPRIKANHVEAELIHEATIGKIAGEQLIKLMSLGLDQKKAEEEIIQGFLN